MPSNTQIRSKIVAASLLVGLTIHLAANLAAQASLAAQGLGPSGPPADDSAPLPDDPATVMAVVGQSPILWGDIEPKVSGRINEVLSQMGKEVPENQLAPARKHLARGALVQAIQSKMLSESFILEQVGTQSAEKRREISDMMHSRARQIFFDNEVKSLQEKFEIENLTELDTKLRKNGSSLRARQREFTDMMLGHMYMRSKVNKDPQVTIAEINTRYAKQIDSYGYGAKARWEQLSVLFENHPTREAASIAIAAIGREAYFGGNLQAVARDKSEEPFAYEGGLHDWTTKGSLASKAMDKQIFSIPLNRMSEIIEDDQGLHIIRVLERKEAGIQPLANLQEDIREKIKKEKVASAQEKMLTEMHKRIPVWSMYPQDMLGAKPLQPTSIATRPVPNSSAKRR